MIKKSCKPLFLVRSSCESLIQYRGNAYNTGRMHALPWRCASFGKNSAVTPRRRKPKSDWIRGAWKSSLGACTVGLERTAETLDSIFVDQKYATLASVERGLNYAHLGRGCARSHDLTWRLLVPQLELEPWSRGGVIHACTNHLKSSSLLALLWRRLTIPLKIRWKRKTLIMWIPRPTQLISFKLMNISEMCAFKKH